MAGSDIIIILVGVLGLVIFVGAMIQSRQTSRECPSCGHRVPQVDPECRVCGFDFRIIQNDQFGMGPGGGL